MSELMIAEQDRGCRKIMADLLRDQGYRVTVTDSAADALKGILRKDAQVVLLGSEFDNLAAADLIPLLKQCNRDLTIILVSDEVSLPMIRRVRSEGIYYHALKPTKPEDAEEIRQAVRCAFDNIAHNVH
jgi:DNA-binding NtrC family response regulator